MSTVKHLTSHSLNAFLLGGPIPEPLLRLWDGCETEDDSDALANSLPGATLAGDIRRHLAVKWAIRGRKFPLSELRLTK